MSSESKTPSRASIGVNTCTNTTPQSAQSPSGLSAKRCVNGRQIFGFISVMSEDGPDISNVFGIGKNEIKIGRGSQNDIRMNARQFSRHHCTIRINEDGGSFQVRLSNESTQKNATKVLPYVLPHGNSVLLDNPSVFLLQGRRFKWMENCKDFSADSVEKSCGQSIVYLFEESKNQPMLNNVVEHSCQTVRKSPSESKKSPAGSPTSSPKKRRTSLNVSLQLRKAAHRHNFQSSFQQLLLCSPANSIAEEDNDTDEESGESKSSPNLISFSPDLSEPDLASLSPTNPQIISSMHNASGNDKSLIDFSSPSPASPGSPKVSNVGMQSPSPSKSNVSVSEESVSVSARTSAASTRQGLRVSGTENKVNPDVIHGSDLRMENESVLGISALYKTVEEGNTTLNSSQVSSTFDAFTPIKNNDSSPRKSIRRSSRLFDGSETPNHAVIKTTIDATLHSPAPSGTPIVSSVEMHSPLPSITSLSQEAFAAMTSSTPTRKSLRVSCMENKDNPGDRNESVLGISALYKTVEEGNTTLNSTQASSIFDAAIDASPIKNNDAGPRIPMRRSSRLCVGPETLNQTANKSIIDVTSHSPAPSGSPKVSNVEMQSTSPSNVSVSAVSVSGESSPTPTRQSLRDSCIENKDNPDDGNESILGISALYKTVEEETTTLNSSQASPASDSSSSAIKNNETTPQTPIRRSSRLFVGPETPNETATPSPAGSLNITNFEMYSTPCSNVSLSKVSVCARTSAVPTRRSLRASGTQNKVNLGDIHRSDFPVEMENESVLGISALYKTVEEGNTTLNSSQAASTCDADIDATPIKNNDATPRTPIRRSSRLCVGLETPNLTANLTSEAEPEVPVTEEKKTGEQSKTTNKTPVKAEPSSVEQTRTRKGEVAESQAENQVVTPKLKEIRNEALEEAEMAAEMCKSMEVGQKRASSQLKKISSSTDLNDSAATLLSPADSRSDNDESIMATSHSPAPSGSPVGMQSLLPSNPPEEPVFARTSAAPTRRSLRVSSMEDKANTNIMRLSDVPLQNESVLGISALYKTDEEENTTLNSCQASYICSAASPIKNNDTTPWTPTRRSSKLFVGMETPNQTANKFIIDATFHSPAPSGSHDITNFEIHSAPPSNVSLFEESFSARTPATPTTRQSIRTSCMKNKATLDVIHGSAFPKENESVLGISALYKTVEEGNTTLNSSQASSIFDADIDATPIKNNGTAPRTPIRRSSRLCVGPETPNQIANKSIINATSHSPASPAPSGFHDIINVEMSSTPLGKVSLSEESVSGESSVKATRQSTRMSGMKNKDYDNCSSDFDLSMKNTSVLGISALYKTVEEVSTTLNSSEAASTCDAGSPVKNDDAGPLTPFRRSSRIFVGPDTPNQTGNLTTEAEPEAAVKEEKKPEENTKTTNESLVEVEASLTQPRTRKVNVSEPQAEDQVVTPKPKRRGKKTLEESEEVAEIREQMQVIRKKRSQLDKTPSSEESNRESETAIMEETKTEEQIKTTKVDTEPSVKQSRTRKVKVAESQAEIQLEIPKVRRIPKKTKEENAKIDDPIELRRQRTRTRSKLNTIPSSEEPNNEPETEITEETKTLKTKPTVLGKTSVKQPRTRKLAKVAEPQIEAQVVTPKPKRLPKKLGEESEEAAEISEPKPKRLRKKPVEGKKETAEMSELVKVGRKNTRSQLNNIPSSEKFNSEPETAIMEENNTEEHIQTTNKTQVEVETSLKQRTRKVKVAEPQAEVQVVTPKPKRLRKKPGEESEGSAEMSEKVIRKKTRSQLNKIPSSEEPNSEPETVITEEKNAREQGKTTKAPVEAKQSRRRKVNVSEPQAEDQVVTPKPKRRGKKTLEESEEVAEIREQMQVIRKKTRSQLNKTPSSEETNSESETAIMEETKTEEQIKRTKAPVEAEPSVKQSRTRKVKVAQPDVQVDTPKPKRLRKKAVEENEGNVEMSESLEVTEVSRKRTWTRSQLNKIASSEESNNEPELVIPKEKKTREQSKTTNAPVETESSVKQTRTRKVKVTEPQSEGQVVTPKPKRLPKKTVEENEENAEVGAPVEVSRKTRKRTRVQLDKVTSSEESNNEAGTNKRRLRERK